MNNQLLSQTFTLCLSLYSYIIVGIENSLLLRRSACRNAAGNIEKFSYFKIKVSYKPNKYW